MGIIHLHGVVDGVERCVLCGTILDMDVLNKEDGWTDTAEEYLSGSDGRPCRPDLVDIVGVHGS